MNEWVVVGGKSFRGVYWTASAFKWCSDKVSTSQQPHYGSDLVAHRNLSHRMNLLFVFRQKGRKWDSSVLQNYVAKLCTSYLSVGIAD